MELDYRGPESIDSGFLYRVPFMRAIQCATIKKNDLLLSYRASRRAPSRLVVSAWTDVDGRPGEPNPFFVPSP